MADRDVVSQDDGRSELEEAAEVQAAAGPDAQAGPERAAADQRRQPPEVGAAADGDTAGPQRERADPAEHERREGRAEQAREQPAQVDAPACGSEQGLGSGGQGGVGHDDTLARGQGAVTPLRAGADPCKFAAMNLRPLPAGVALGLALALLGAGAVWRVARVRGRGLLAFGYHRKQLPAQAWAALAAKPGWRAETVPAATPGLSLRGLVRAPRTAGAPWVLFFQGNSTRLLAEGQEFLEALAAQDDLGLAVVAWRGFDGSAGEPSREALLADAVAQVAWLRANGAGSAPLHLVGFSMGTLPAVAAALAAQGGPAETRPRSLTLLATFTALQMCEAGRLNRFLTTEDWDLLPRLGALALPTLVVHGAADQTLPVAMGRAVAQAIPGARFVEVAGQGHVPLLLDERALAAVRAVVLQKE